MLSSAYISEVIDEANDLLGSGSRVAMADVVFDICQTPGLCEGVEMMLDRGSEFPTRLEAVFAGIAVSPTARLEFESQLDYTWATTELPEKVEELVIGSGVHAAIYCAVRYREKGIRPFVLESGKRIGGTMAISKNPSFWLNSRNRPGPLGVPGQKLGLNVIQGGLIQPSLVSGAEFQTNADLAFAVRSNLMMFSSGGVPGVRVKAITKPKKTYYKVLLESGEVISARRVVIATGSGRRNPLGMFKKMISFEDLMANMDNPFPLRGMNRIAVVGGGDSGKCAIQALCGQGPTSNMSVAMLDWPDKIDWYGVPSGMTASVWCRDNRSLYSRIGALFGKRVYGRGRADVNALSDSYNGIQIQARKYDWVINCTGLLPSRLNGIEIPQSWDRRQVDFNRNYTTGYRFRSRDEYDPDYYDDDTGVTYRDEDVFIVGPASQIPVDADERDSSAAVENIPENSTSLFRYADRTAMIAAMT